MKNDNGTKREMFPRQNEILIKTDRRTSLLITMTIFVPLIEFLALVFLPIIFPAISVLAWFILLVFFVLTLALSILANFVMRKNVIPVKDLPNEKVNIIEDPILGSSLRDPVTNLFNKHFLEETLASELQRSLRRQKIIGVIRLEVDDFENIVKTYSSSVSDMLLKKIAEYLRESIRASDVACRLDDQEFILVMNGVSRDLTLERAEHLRVNAKNIKLKYEDQTFDGIKLSLGVAVYPEHGTTVKALLENTEVALRLARSDGGNRVVVYQKNLE